jgi:UDP-N-acetylmuramyl pentapeptide phosphotransferase/UDP-N-acetylglucosamine-1-phosphate transferase
MWFDSPIYLAFAVSLACSVGLVLTGRWHTWLSGDFGLGIQKVHLAATPRVGGVAIFIGVAAAYVAGTAEQGVILGPLWMAGCVAFAFGLLEDLTKRVPVTTRLLATILSGVVGWAITSLSLHRVGLPWVDDLLSHQGMSVMFTAFAIGGIANAINIIDGLNGLASAMKVIAFTAVALIAHAEGDAGLAFATLSIAAAVLGFFLVNWPMGKLFLGDGGSYFGGFALAWSCVLLVERNQSVAPFAALMVCIYPFIEVLFSIYRRKVKQLSPGQPDRQHLHSLIYRRYIVTVAPTVKENSVAGILVAMLNLPPAIAAYYLKHSNLWACVACVGFCMGYVLIYRRVVKFSWS